MAISFLRGSKSDAAAGAEARGRGAAAPGAQRDAVLRECAELGIGMFWATDADGCLSFLSEQALRDLGADDGGLIGCKLVDLFRDVEEGSGVSQRPLAFKLKAGSRIEEQLISITPPGHEHGGPQTRWWRINGRPLLDGKGRPQGYRGSAIDITAQYANELQTARQSQIDELTGLANRRRLGERLTATLAAFRATRRACALLMLDLDRFKHVNDTMGHPAGDELLKQVAARLQAIVKDRGEVGRLGGDEFQVILPDMDDRGALAELAGRLVQSVSQPYQINGRRAIIGASVGMAIAPYDGLEADELTSAADLALYAAKQSHGGTFRFFSTDLRDHAARTAALGIRLRDAIDREHLRLVYQPVVDANTSKVKCFEALMRWRDPEEGEISPGLFIPIAESDETIIRLGDFALRQACADAVQWPEEIRVAVNISATHFSRPDFRKTVAAVLETTGLAPNRLELEITESVFVGNTEAVEASFKAMRKLGVRIALDDFGTGYSSLGYLKHGHFHKIKIDQSFVRGCTESGDINPAIITAIVALARALGMETVAEGVEAMDELALVRARGADLIQGHIFSRALEKDAVLEAFAQGTLTFAAAGPPKHRAERVSILKKIGLIHEDHYYDVLLRNISRTGARITGLSGVPVGTDIVLDLGHGQLVVAKVVNATDTAQGVKFETPLIPDGQGGFMTRLRISPYALAEAGLPLAALGAGAFPLSQVRNLSRASIPKFVQHDFQA